MGNIYTLYLLVYWTQGPPGLREPVPPPWPVRLRVLAILDHLGPQIPNNLNKNGQYENCSHFWDIFLKFFEKNLKKSFWTMFLYRVKYNESESDIQNNDLLYKTNQKYQKPFDFFVIFWKFQKYIFFKKFDFKMISVLWRFVWPAFGGPKILVYIYIWICYGQIGN